MSDGKKVMVLSIIHPFDSVEVLWIFDDISNLHIYECTLNQMFAEFYPLDYSEPESRGWYLENQVYYETEQRELRHADCYRLLKSVLKLEHSMTRKVYRKTQENLDREEQERKNRECERAKVRIEESDLDWKPLHVNNILSNPIVGYYEFLFKRQEDGQIFR